MKTSEQACVTEEVTFVGHAMVKATHGRTIEITTEEHLTPRGDCIIGVGASKGISELSPAMKKALRSDEARVRFTIVAPGGEFSFVARGSKDLSFESPTDMVIRKSTFVCGRTLAIRAESSASEVPRSLVGTLKSPGAAGLLRIEVSA
ncbi:MAG: DUF371 domain-containing protein [Thaumarchaeota archaeon]|nr:DUF371 domain-containing protein [Nitrososphaerota archaeon]